MYPVKGVTQIKNENRNLLYIHEKKQRIKQETIHGRKICEILNCCYNICFICKTPDSRNFRSLFRQESANDLYSLKF